MQRCPSGEQRRHHISYHSISHHRHCINTSSLILQAWYGSSQSSLTRPVCRSAVASRLSPLSKARLRSAAADGSCMLYQPAFAVPVAERAQAQTAAGPGTTRAVT
jgi:hypothetical protein